MLIIPKCIALNLYVQVLLDIIMLQIFQTQHVQQVAYLFYSNSDFIQRLVPPTTQMPNPQM